MRGSPFFDLGTLKNRCTVNMQETYRAHRKTTFRMDAIDCKSIHHRGFSDVLGARSQFFEMPYG